MFVGHIPVRKIVMLLDVQDKQGINFVFRQPLLPVQCVKSVISILGFGKAVILVIPAYCKVDRKTLPGHRLVFPVPLGVDMEIRREQVRPVPMTVVSLLHPPWLK